MTAITNKNASAATLSYYDYTYDSASRVSTQTWQSQTTTGALLSGAYTYSYDATNQLLSDGTATYSYDANGNPAAAGYQTGTGNEITTDGTWTYTYDAAGDVVEKSKGAGLETWYYGYDTLNRLTSIEQTTNGTTAEYTATYTYDVLGHRFEEQDWQSGGSTTTTYSAFDGDQVWADLTSGMAVTTRYVRAPGAQDLYARIDVGVGLRQISEDALGSVRDVWDGTGVLDHVEYSAYGVILSETAATVGGRYLYTGLAEDRTSQTVGANDGTRTELTPLGRWLQPDPITVAAGDANFERYVGNDPTNRVDPTGLDGVAPGPLLTTSISAPTATPPMGWRPPPLPPGSGYPNGVSPMGKYLSGWAKDADQWVWDFGQSHVQPTFDRWAADGPSDFEKSIPVFGDWAQAATDFAKNGWGSPTGWYHVVSFSGQVALLGLGGGEEPAGELGEFGARPTASRRGRWSGTGSGAEAIDTVKAGERVWAYDLIAGEWRTCRVIQTFRRRYDGHSVFVTAEGDTIEDALHRSGGARVGGRNARSGRIPSGPGGSRHAARVDAAELAGRGRVAG